MKLLFDQNISFKVAKKVQDIFPGANTEKIVLRLRSDVKLITDFLVSTDTAFLEIK
jgi:hypothetical protein